MAKVDGKGAAVLMGVAAAILAAEPAAWLARSWVDPSYDSIGGYAVAVVLGLVAWSASSARRDGSVERAAARRRAVRLLVGTAVVRLVGRLLAVNVVGALALVIDVYALGVLLGLDRRARAVAPVWLAAAFAFALPVERIVQRTIGYGLQHVSAAGACELLQAAVGEGAVACAGTRIWIAGKDVLVDLPCSGARGLIQLALLFVVLRAVRGGERGARGAWWGALAGAGATLAVAVAVNTVRIAALAVGIAWPDLVLGVDVMAEPWHGGIGMVALAAGAAVVVVLAGRGQGRGRAVARAEGGTLAGVVRVAAVAEAPARGAGLRAALFAAACAGIAAVPGRPVDVSGVRAAPELPRYLDAHPAIHVPLSEKESQYFTQYGGGAAKAAYGDRSLLMVRTTSPLRHLHAPDECLAGAGHEVRFAGVTFGRLPAAVYESKDPSGRRWRVAVTFLSEDGRVATSVAEVVWRWLERPGTAWTAVQRIGAWDAAPGDAERFDEAVVRAMELR